MLDATLAQLNAAGRFSTEVNTAYATMLRDFYATLGGRMGLTASEAHARYRLDIQAAQLAEPASNAQKHAERAAFSKWTHGARLVPLGAQHYWRSGEPVVVHALHGTTKDFTQFDRSTADIENNVGAGFYFTNGVEDAAENYAGFGPDLTYRIERLAEHLVENDEIDAEAAMTIANERLAKNAGFTMPCYVRFDNPVVLGGDVETVFTYEASENDEDEDGNFQLPTGTLVAFIEELRDVCRSDRYDSADPESAIEDIILEARDYGQISAQRLMAIAKKDDRFSLAQDMETQSETSSLVASELLRQTFENLGFDGIIDRTVFEKFGRKHSRGIGMKGLDKDSIHFVAFRPEQIKSALGNLGTWSESNPSILHQAAPEAAAAPGTDQTFRLGDLPRDMRERLFNEHAMSVDPEATERAFNDTRVPSGVISLADLDVSTYPLPQIERLLVADPDSLPPIVIADGRLIDGGHRINAARLQGRTELRFIDLTGVVDTDSAGYISALPRAALHAAVRQSETGTATDLLGSATETATTATPGPALSQWFGDSAVVDGSGRPRVLFHGTNQSFDNFDHARSREGGVVWMTPDARAASAFALHRTTWSGANVMPVFAKADRLLRIDGNFGDIRQVERETRLGGMLDTESLQDFAKREGYDGILFERVRDDVGPSLLPHTDIYAFFETAQFKSAIGAQAFDPASRNVLHQAPIPLPRQSPDTRDPFADSKVVDSQGNLLRVFHGTQSSFDSFDSARLGQATRHPTALAGHFFSVDPSVASSFAGEDWEGWPLEQTFETGGNVMPVHLAIESPVEMPVDTFVNDYVQGRGDFAGFARAARAAGHDGIRIVGDPAYRERLGAEEYAADAWVAFDPAQVRSAFARPAARQQFAQSPAAAEPALEGIVSPKPDRADISMADDITSGPSIVTLHEAADESSLPHEGAHFFLEVYSHLAAQKDAPTVVRDDMNALLDWFGIKGTDDISQPGRKQSHAQALKSWLKDSKVRGVVYHGTSAVFNEFDTSNSDLGAHFGNRAQAEIAAARHTAAGEQTQIKEVWLNIKKPLRLKDQSSFHADGIAPQLAAKGLISKAEAKRIVTEIESDFRLRKKYDPMLRDVIKEAGYDGVVYANAHEGSGDSWIAFDASQIMSATSPKWRASASVTLHQQAQKPAEAAVAREAAFSAWFAGSKILDNDGRPRILYHGTKNDFESFDLERQGANDHGWYGRGIYLSADPGTASAYTGYENVKSGGRMDALVPGANVMPVYVSLKNPYVWPEGRAAALTAAERDALTSELQALGHDGVIVPNQYQDPQYAGFHEVIAFDPGSVKSTFNSGEFNPTNRSILHQTAYHGTPHHGIESFHTDHIGTGEGNQTFGWGLYFASVVEVAEHYRRRLTSGSPDALHRHALAQGLEPELADTMAQSYAASRMMRFDDFADVMMDTSPSEYIELFRKKYIRPAIISGKAREVWDSFRGAGQVYEVKLPEPEMMLSWDDSVYDDQSFDVHEALQRVAEDYRQGEVDTAAAEAIDTILEDAYEDRDMTGADLYHKLAYALGDRIRETYNIEPSPMNASLALADIGIKGIRYLDGDSRGSAGTHNYVIFDGADVEVRSMLYQAAHRADDAQGDLKALRAAWAKRGVEIDAYLREDVITVSRLVVEPSLRNAGLGTQAMKDLAQFADDRGASMQLSPSRDFGATSVARLQRFYQRLGFVNNRGRSRDYSISATMVRKPAESRPRLQLVPTANAPGTAPVLGRTPLDTWRAMSMDQRRPYHEQFARGFEAFLMEGNAPTPKLEGIFESFRTWLTLIYRSVTQLKVDLTPAVRGVMGRMLSSDAGEGPRHGAAAPAGVPEHGTRQASIARLKQHMRSAYVAQQPTAAHVLSQEDLSDIESTDAEMVDRPRFAA